MIKDKYQAVWVSHSSISDFLKCPRLYFLNNIYKDPATGHKIQLIEPPLALGQAVHDVIESLSTLPVDKRLEKSLLDKFKESWRKISGKKGGFKNKKQEKEYKERGVAMIERVMKNPGPIARLAVKIKQDLPHYYLSEEEDIILCGKIDWLEYLKEEKRVHIIDFKTGAVKENNNSLQLPIYLLLVKNTQSHKVKKASYWFLEYDDSPKQIELPTPGKAKSMVLKAAKMIKDARKNKAFACPRKGCGYCTQLEEVISGKGEFVGVSEYNQDIYILP